MNISLVKDLVSRSAQGTIGFPEVVTALTKEGFESYHVDIGRSENRFYLPAGESHVETMPLKYPMPAMQFSALQVKAAILDIQKGRIKYKEFMEKIIAAGTVYYIVYLSGKRVIYFGREGDFHIELFPQNN